MPRPDAFPLAPTTKPNLIALATPCINLETPPHLLDDDITPSALLFTRNTGTVPDLDEAGRDDWTLAIGGLVGTPRTFTLADLRRDFETFDQQVVLECAGNGRAFFDPPAGTVLWQRGAIGCPHWTGVRLADVLAACGPLPEARHTACFSPDTAIDSDRPAFSRGTPLEKAMAPETMLAFALNGAPLSRLHGGPLRVVTPGYPGAGSQKWVMRIDLRADEHDGPKMKDGWYRMPRVPVRPGQKVDDSLTDAITDLPVKSLITFPAEGFVAPAGAALTIRGHAWSGHTPVARVGVSFDGGMSWKDAALDPLPDRFAWRRFTATLASPARGPLEIVARAFDGAGNAQPMESVPWNPRGYLNNLVHRLRGEVR